MFVDACFGLSQAVSWPRKLLRCAGVRGGGHSEVRCLEVCRRVGRQGPAFQHSPVHRAPRSRAQGPSQHTSAVHTRCCQDNAFMLCRRKCSTVLSIASLSASEGSEIVVAKSLQSSQQVTVQPWVARRLPLTRRCALPVSAVHLLAPPDLPQTRCACMALRCIGSLLPSQRRIVQIMADSHNPITRETSRYLVITSTLRSATRPQPRRPRRCALEYTRVLLAGPSRWRKYCQALQNSDYTSELCRRNSLKCLHCRALHEQAP